LIAPAESGRKCNANPYVFIVHSSIDIMSLVEETLELIKPGIVFSMKDRLSKLFSITKKPKSSSQETMAS